MWSIGIYIGNSPFNLTSENLSNPVLAAEDITDTPAKFVADPFMVKENYTWYMFFEVMNTHTNKGEIGLAISNDGLSWIYKQIVLDEPFHLSYPYVFKWKNEYYMTPESCKASSISLYKATDFPTKWKHIHTLLKGSYADPSIFHYDDKWWMFLGNPQSHETLRLYYADKLIGPWTEHPKSPIIKDDATIARPGGRIIIFDNRIFRFAQDDLPIYGKQIRMLEITEITTTNYKEKEITESPLLKASGNGWNEKGMHHVDPHQIDGKKWIACVDGYRKISVFKIRSRYARAEQCKK